MVEGAAGADAGPEAGTPAACRCLRTRPAHHRDNNPEDALRWWRRALELDPRNFTVRKQVWRAEHPERFYPTIDAEWQKEQLAREEYVP
jgi:hypothetical protein